MSFEVEIGDDASAIVQLEVTSDVKVDALSFAKCLGAFKVHSVSVDKDFQSVSPTIISLEGNPEACQKVFRNYFSTGKKLVVNGCWYKVRSVRCSDLYTFEAMYSNADPEIDEAIEQNRTYRDHIQRSLTHTDKFISSREDGAFSMSSILDIIGDKILNLQHVFDQHSDRNDWIPLRLAVLILKGLNKSGECKNVDIDSFPSTERIYYSDFLKLYVQLQRSGSNDTEGITRLTTSSDSRDEESDNITNDPIDELRRRRLRHLNEKNMFMTGIHTVSSSTSLSSSSFPRKKPPLPPIVLEPKPSDFVPISLPRNATKVMSSKLYATLEFWDHMRVLTRSKVEKLKLRKYFEEVSLDDIYSSQHDYGADKNIFKSDLYNVLCKTGLVVSESWLLEQFDVFEEKKNIEDKGQIRWCELNEFLSALVNSEKTKEDVATIYMLLSRLIWTKAKQSAIDNYIHRRIQSKSRTQSAKATSDTKDQKSVENDEESKGSKEVFLDTPSPREDVFLVSASTNIDDDSDQKNNPPVQSFDNGKE